MADLNALIAQGAQFNMPDQLGQYAKMQQLQAGQQQMRTGALQEQTAGMQLEQLKQDRDNMAKLSQQLSVKGIGPRQYFEALQTSGDPKHQQLGIEGLMKLDQTEKYDAFLKSQQTIPAGQAPAPMAGGLGSGTFGLDSMPGMPNALAPRAAAPMASTNALAPTPAAADPVATLETKIAQLRSFKDDRAQAEAVRLQKQVDEYNKVHSVGGSLMTGTGRLVGTAPIAPPVPALPLTPDVEAQRIRIANASRAPLQPVAPTITQIVDPANPNQMITIDARRYQGGGAGSPGVIGVAGKEPSAALRTNKVEAGKTQLADDLDNLRASFQTLDQMRAIPSTERNVVSNLMSASAASGLGQTLGRAGGSPEQVERDVINSVRQRLVNSIKNATGMSAQQLNSNVELQTMLKSISDPGQSVQAAMRIIDDIENAYVKGNGTLPKRGAERKPAAGNAVDTSNPLLK
jgi:hypothetical protein